MFGSVARVALVLALASSTAFAQAYDDPDTERLLCQMDGSCPKPDETTTPPAVPAPVMRAVSVRRAHRLALARNAVVVTITTETSMGTGTMLDSTSLAPDVSYGVTDRVTLSLVHSGFATTGFRGSAGGGLCLSGDARGCEHPYNNAGLDALVDLVRADRFAIAGVAGLHAVSIDQRFVDVKLGAQASYRTGKVTATLSPSVFVGVTERAMGNEGTVFAPGSISVQLSRDWLVAMGGGVATPIADPTGGWTVRLGSIVRYRVRPGLFVAGSLFLPKLAGGAAVDGTGVDARVANLWVTYAR
jgi:hypothetical protein